MRDLKILKRDGREVQYDSSKIVVAISKATKEVLGNVKSSEIYSMEEEVYRTLMAGNYPLTVEGIQDCVENILLSTPKYIEVGKAYVRYRYDREKARKNGWEMTELQKDIFNQKYRNDEESFEEFIFRVSGGNDEVMKAIRNKEFLPAGRVLAGRGLDRNVTLSNCYVIEPPEDNIESIFDTAKYMARTYSYGGGCGTDISNLRPKNSKVNNASLTTSGAVSFMELYSTTTGLIGQMGRRGALMLSMSSDHPDIKEFITSKRDIDKINSANISVRISSDFMKKYKDGDKESVEIMNMLAQSNWESGEPGMLFWDRVENWHLLSENPAYFITGTNPCGEVPLNSWGSCLLGSINLSLLVDNPFTDKAKIDYNKLRELSRIATIGMNEILDEGIPLHPLEQQRDNARRFRQIGIGMMGLSDLFIKMGVKYGSQESIDISDKLGETIRYTAIETSCNLAVRDGVYPEYNFELISKSPYFQSLPEHLQEMIESKGMRNSHLLSIAPTGSISTMIGVSGGIEPIFANSFTRTTKSLSSDGDKTYKVYTDVIQELMEVQGIKNEEDLPEYCVTSHDINPFDRIKVQATWQKYIDSAISSTINLHEDTDPKVIEEIYYESWKQGLKGITVFRDNCFRTGILNVDVEKSKLDKIDELKEEMDKLILDELMENPDVCPMCGGKLMHSGGCSECEQCSYSPCSI